MTRESAQDGEILDGFVMPADVLRQDGQDSLLFDLTAVGNWLEPFKRKSPHTHRAYQRIAAYWLYFLEQTHGHHADLLRRTGPADAHDFLRALSHDSLDERGSSREPENRASGSGKFDLARAISSDVPFWQDRSPRALPNHFGVVSNPFARAKSQRSVAQTVAALSSLYKFNNTKRSHGDAALLDFNPFSDLGRFLVKHDAKTDRVFEPAAYLRLLAATDHLLHESETTMQQQRAVRLRWITVALFNLWMRISELAGLRMSDLRQRGGIWFASVHGKGRKVRAVEITPAVMKELMAYRESLGLPAMPQRHESDIPVVVSLRRSALAPYPGMTSRALFGEIKELGSVAAERLLSSHPDPGDLEVQSLANRLRQISPHWFRHSGASEAINGHFPIADAAERLGHKDPAITVRMYYHGDARRRVGALQALEQAREKEQEK
jgi:integrase